MDGNCYYYIPRIAPLMSPHSLVLEVRSKAPMASGPSKPGCISRDMRQVYDGPIGEGFFIWPTTGTTISGYTFSDFHPGIDIAGSTGNAVYASASGVVVCVGWNNYGYGNGNVIGGVGSTGN